MTKNNGEQLVIISGASRGIGKSFADYYKSRENSFVIGLGRSNKQGITILDLLDEPTVNNFVSKLDLNKFNDLIYMHTVGIDKFEPDGKPHIDRDSDGIDDEVYSSNVTTFLNLAEPLVDKIKLFKTPTTIIQIGAIGDIYNVPFWQSFTRSKNIVRK